MLRFLRIERLAVIDAVDLELGPGLNVLTGETGAGKSIIVGAVELLLGGRASADLVRSGEQTANIEAILETPDGRELIVRRDLSSSGRSRASVDSTLVTNADLREVTASLVDLHGQHDHQALLDPSAHLALLDRYGRMDDLVEEVGVAFDEWRGTREALASLQLSEQERLDRLDVTAFQLAEIDRIAPAAREDEDLIATRRLLQEADRVKRLCTEAFDDLYGGEGAVLDKLSRVWKRVDDLAELDSAFGPLAAARDSIGPALEELAYALRDRGTHLEASPERLQAIEDRLALLERLKRRHGGTLDAVLSRRAELIRQREALERTSERRVELEAIDATKRQRFADAARRLSLRRRDVAAKLQVDLATELSALALPGAACELRFAPGDLPETGWLRSGVDAGQLYFAANVGEEARPLVRTASGGELSRVMLALKTLATIDLPGKTLIFDEVDAGIGGRAADAVGARLRRLGEDFQVLCITHLPQVAAHAHVHFRVAKETDGGRTRTSVRRLAEGERVEELARMLGGDTRTPAMLASARELLLLRAGRGGEGESPRAKAKVSGRK